MIAQRRIRTNGRRRAEVEAVVGYDDQVERVVEGVAEAGLGRFIGDRGGGILEQQDRLRILRTAREGGGAPLEKAEGRKESAGGPMRA